MTEGEILELAPVWLAFNGKSVLHICLGLSCGHSCVFDAIINVNAFLVAPTWCDNSGHRRTFQMTLGSVYTDVVLHTRIQAL